jgi:glycosyltransferase involved in cell wall biosynthesis
LAVSVIIPNFNNEPYIEQCIRSVADDPAVGEIILYDDCSTDGSVEIAGSLSITKLRILRGKENVGATRAREASVRVSSGDLLCFLDADDFLSPGAVSKACEALKRIDADFSLFRLITVARNGRQRLGEIAPPASSIDGRTAFEQSLGGWTRIHTLGVFRRDAYDRARSRFVPHGYSDDELLYRLLLLSSERVCGNDGCYFYRRVEKPPTAKSIVGITRNRIRTIELAREEGIASDALRQERNMVVRNLLGVLYRSANGGIDRRSVSALLAEYAGVHVGWKAGDFPYLAPSAGLKLLAKMSSGRGLVAP